MLPRQSYGATRQSTIIIEKKNNMRQKLLIIFSAFLLTLRLTVACGEITTPQVAVTTASNGAVPNYDWANNWLKGIPCRAPCFEGITPGVTKATDALKIVKGYSYTRNITTFKFAGYFGHNIMWNWYNDDAENSIYYEPSDDIVYAIQFSISDIQLDRVIALYGEPDKIATVVQKGDGSYVGKLIYYVRVIYNQGLLLIHSSVGTPPTLSGSLEFDTPLFYDPKRIPSDYNSAFQVSDWQGMKDFYFYCTDKGYCR
jgi:hypothetical protein